MSEIRRKKVRRKKVSNTDMGGMTLEKHEPRQRSHRFSETQKKVSRIPTGDRSIKRGGPSLDIIKPKWAEGTPTTVRILPNFNPDMPAGPFDRTRLTIDDKDNSDWVRAVPAARYVGIDEKYTFITHDRMREYDDGYKPYLENPYHTLFNALMDTISTGEAFVGGKNVYDSEEWNPLISSKSKDCAFNSPTVMYYMQCLVYDHNEEVFVAGDEPPKGARPGDLPQVLQVSKTGGDDLCTKLNALNPEYNGDTSMDNQDDMYLYGDLVDLQSGGFVTFINTENHKDITDKITGEYAVRMASDPGYSRWNAAINETFTYVSRRETYDVSSDVSQYESEIRDNLLWWDDVLHIPEHEEICLWLAQAFSKVPNFLYFGWKDHPEFFTDEVKGILQSRVTVSSVEMPSEELDGYEEEEEVEETEMATSTTAVVEDDFESADVSLDGDDEDEDEYEEEVVDEDVDEDDLDEDEEEEIESAMKAAEERAAKRTTRRIPRKRQ